MIQPRIGAPLGSRNAAKGSTNRVRVSYRLPRETVDQLREQVRCGNDKSLSDLIARLVGNASR